VPARDEADRLGRLLDALADQDVEGPVNVVVALNNTRDGSAKVVTEAKRRHASRLVITLDQHDFPFGLAHAGSARQRAMALGVVRLECAPRGVLISTDADTCPPPDWVRCNLYAIEDGADLVGGRLVIDESELLEPEAAKVRAMWDAYWARVRAIEDDIDPLAGDPAPRHGDHTGASLAITVEAYEAAGGVPILETGEDRALVNAALAAGRSLAHPMSVWTRVSPRQDGRATGGMAEDMRRLRADATAGRLALAPAFEHWRARALWRRDIRDRLGPSALMAQEAALPPMPHDRQLFWLLARGAPS
jgi:cellulose synthase/poly-beta-1,6-N-acetylglucosamine synthase-like glycosyltransferase